MLVPFPKTDSDISPPPGKIDDVLLVKVFLFGDSSAGKTNVLLNYTGDSSHSFISTIGVDFKVKNVEIEGTHVKMQIWDTAGQERFRSISSAQLRGAHGAVLVYNINDRNSFNEISNWVKTIQKHSDNIEFILFGNNNFDEDLPPPVREVSTAEGQALAREFEIHYFEGNAKDIRSRAIIEQMFLTLLKPIKDRLLHSH